MTAALAFAQVTHCFRNDNGSEVNASYRQAEGADDTIPAGSNFRLRFKIDETGGGTAWSNITWNLYYQKNGSGGYVPVTADTPVRFALSDYFADHDDCTGQLTGGTGGWVTDNNGMAEAAGVTNSGTKGYLFETEWCLIGNPASITEGDYFDFRIYNGSSAIAAYTDTPRATITKIHALVDKDIITPAPTVTKSVIGQVHVLVDKDMVTSVPTVTKPVLEEAAGGDELTSKDIITSVPTVTKSVIGQIHALVDKDIATAVPTVTRSSIGQVHVLTDKDMVTPVPTVSKSVIGQVHILTDKDITTSVPTVTKSVLGIAEAGTDNLVSKDITTSVPTVTKSTIGQIHNLIDKDVETPVPTITKIIIGQKHILVVKDVTTPVPTVTRSVIGQVHVLVDKDMITLAPTITKPVLAEAGGGTPKRSPIYYAQMRNSE